MTRRLEQAVGRVALIAWCGAIGCGGSSGSDAPSASETDDSASDDGSGSTTDSSGSSDDSTGGETDGEPEVEVEYLTPQQHLVRVSMALRGIRPSPEELVAIEADPESIGAFVDAYMAGPGFEEMIRDLHNDALLTRIEGAFPALEPLADQRPSTISESVMGTALHLVQHVVVEDRPYTEIVTADYWVVDDIAAAVYGIDDGQSGWREVPMPSDRPGAGVLSDNAFFLRHQSAGANYHRGRANAVSSALLCLDFQDTNIELDGGVDLTDPEAVATAVTTNPSCVACHDALDPLASHFFTFPGSVMGGDVVEYPVPDFFRSTAANGWEEATGRAPGYFGEPTEDLGALARAIADDERFSACTARRFHAYFLQRRWDEVPSDTIEQLEAVLRDNDFSAKALIRSIMLSDEFRVAAAANPEDAEEVRGYLRARPFQLALLLEDLTRFRWELEPIRLDPGQGEGVISLPRASAVGFQVLAGGGDSLFVTTSATTMNATTGLFMRQFAAEAASFVVEHDLDGAETPSLIGSGQATDETRVREQLAQLFLRLYGEEVPPDGEDVSDAWAVFSAVLQQSADVRRAWKATLSAMLQDLDIIYY